MFKFNSRSSFSILQAVLSSAQPLSPAIFMIHSGLILLDFACSAMQPQPGIPARPAARRRPAGRHEGRHPHRIALPCRTDECLWHARHAHWPLSPHRHCQPSPAGILHRHTGTHFLCTRSQKATPFPPLLMALPLATLNVKSSSDLTA